MLKECIPSAPRRNGQPKLDQKRDKTGNQNLDAIHLRPLSKILDVESGQNASAICFLRKPLPQRSRRKVREGRKEAPLGTRYSLLATLSLLYSPFMLKQTLEQGRMTTDAALERLLPAATQHPASIHKAMRHSVFAGGKRLRPILSMEAGRMVAGSLPSGIEEVGAALEMLHTYSLIHDDLPALDNDDLRRGRPTCHKVFGEAIAILAGDALQTQAYEVLANLQCSPEARVKIIAEISKGTGTVNGMIGGQVVDLEAERIKPDGQTLEYIHRSKTAALITASLVSGGIYGGGISEQVAS